MISAAFSCFFVSTNSLKSSLLFTILSYFFSSESKNFSFASSFWRFVCWTFAYFIFSSSCFSSRIFFYLAGSIFFGFSSRWLIRSCCSCFFRYS